MPKKTTATEVQTPSIEALPAIVRQLIDSIDVSKLVAEMAPDLPTDDHEAIAKDAAGFVYKGVFMGLVSSIDAGIRSGSAKIDEASRQLASAIQSDLGSNRSDRTQARVESRTKWAVQQMAQQDIRRALRATFAETYHQATGEAYVANGSNSAQVVREQSLDTSAQRTAASLLSRMQQA